MGCDIWYEGSLPDETLQTKVIRFVLSCLEEIDLHVKPAPEKKYLTTLKSREPPVEYAFNFFGVIPRPLFGGGLLPHQQFVFDRTAGGKLVHFVKLPIEFKIPPHDKYYESVKSEVVLEDGGYTREIASYNYFSLLLNIIRLRWWPEMRISDDYCVSEGVVEVLEDSGLSKIFKNEELDYPKCWGMFQAELQIRHPKIEMPEKPEPILRPLTPDAARIPVEDLDFPLRTNLCLKEANIRTVGELVLYGKANLRKIMSRSLVNDLVEILQEKVGIDLSYENPGQIPVKDLELTIVATNCLLAANIRTVGELIVCSQADLLKMQDMSCESVNEVVDVLQKLGLHLSAKQGQ